MKLRGFRIELGEIEAVLRAAARRARGVVVVREDDARRPAPRAPTWLRRRAAPARRTLRDARSRQQLPDYMVPAAFVDARRAAADAERQDRSQGPARARGARWDGDAAAYVAPQNAVEEQLAAIWCDVLQPAQVGVHDSFFDLGGHSMLAAQMMAAVESAFGKKIPLAALFENQTIESLSRFYTGDDAVPERWPLVIPVQPKGSKTPLSVSPGSTSAPSATSRSPGTSGAINRSTGCSCSIAKRTRPPINCSSSRPRPSNIWQP